jgi:hypothetical protein
VGGCVRQPAQRAQPAAEGLRVTLRPLSCILDRPALGLPLRDRRVGEDPPRAVHAGRLGADDRRDHPFQPGRVGQRQGEVLPGPAADHAVGLPFVVHPEPAVADEEPRQFQRGFRGRDPASELTYGVAPVLGEAGEGHAQLGLVAELLEPAGALGHDLGAVRVDRRFGHTDRKPDRLLFAYLAVIQECRRV